jgi:hypothetical protein
VVAPQGGPAEIPGAGLDSATGFLATCFSAAIVGVLPANVVG